MPNWWKDKVMGGDAKRHKHNTAARINRKIDIDALKRQGYSQQQADLVLDIRYTGGSNLQTNPAGQQYEQLVETYFDAAVFDHLARGGGLSDQELDVLLNQAAAQAYNRWMLDLGLDPQTSKPLSGYGPAQAGMDSRRGTPLRGEVDYDIDLPYGDGQDHTVIDFDPITITPGPGWEGTGEENRPTSPPAWPGQDEDAPGGSEDFRIPSSTAKPFDFVSTTRDRLQEYFVEPLREKYDALRRAVQQQRSAIAEAGRYLRDQGIDTLVGYARTAIETAVPYGAVSLEATTIIYDVVQRYDQLSLEHTRKADPRAELIPGALADAMLQAAKGHTVWKAPGEGGLWYWHPDPNYVPQSPAERILRPQQSPQGIQFREIPGNGKPDDRPADLPRRTLEEVAKEKIQGKISEVVLDKGKEVLKDRIPQRRN